MPDQTYQLPRDSTMQGIVTQLQNIASRMNNSGSGSGGSGGGSTVVANPSGTASDDLTSIEIDGTVYDIPSGSGSSYDDTALRALIAAKQDALTPGTGIQISNGTISCTVQEGSGSGGLSFELICEQETIQSTQTLTHSMDSYDAILVNAEAFDSSTGYQSTSLTILENIAVGKNIGVSTENGVVWFTVQSMSSLSLGYHSGDWRNLKIYGVKFGSVGGASSSQEEYSTTEKVIGTWIDGKPVYQKTFAINVHTDGRAWVDTGCVIPNIEHIIDWSIVCNDTYVSGAPANIKTCSFRYYNNNIQIYGNTEWYLDLQAIIVKYTKTTD